MCSELYSGAVERGRLEAEGPWRLENLWEWDMREVLAWQAVPELRMPISSSHLSEQAQSLLLSEHKDGPDSKHIKCQLPKPQLSLLMQILFRSGPLSNECQPIILGRGYIALKLPGITGISQGHFPGKPDTSLQQECGNESTITQPVQAH